MEEILKISQLKVHFPVKGGIWMRPVATCKAVDGVSLELAKGETLGLVGESGCGKSTLARTVVGLNVPTAGEIFLDGQKLGDFRGKLGKENRKRVQMVFQDPAESLNARHTVGQILEEPLVIHQIGDPCRRTARVKELLNLVGLPENAVSRYPFEFSGGQRQRLALARALLADPDVLILDEATNALDAETTRVVHRVLDDLAEPATRIIVTHDLSTIEAADQIYVFDAGCVAAFGSHDELSRSSPLYRKLRSDLDKFIA